MSPCKPALVNMYTYILVHALYCYYYALQYNYIANKGWGFLSLMVQPLVELVLKASICSHRTKFWVKRMKNRNLRAKNSQWALNSSAPLFGMNLIQFSFFSLTCVEQVLAFSLFFERVLLNGPRSYIEFHLCSGDTKCPFPKLC